MPDSFVVNLTSYPEDISVNLSTEVTEISTNLVETTLTFLQGAGLHRENVFTEDNTFQKDVYVGENLTVSGTISASEYLNLPQPDLSQYLPISGGTITGNLSVSGTTTIPHISGNTSLSGDLSITGNLDVTGRASVDNVTFDQTPELAGGVGVLRWNDTDGTLDLGLKGGNVTLQLGQKEVVRVVNKTDENLLQSDYKVVRIRLANEGGAQGQRLAVVLAQGNNDPDSVTTLGVVSENIANNQEGFITTFGHVRNIDTTGSPQGEIWVDGDVLYLSPTVAGGLTNNKPQAPDHVVVIGYVEYAHQNNGKLFIKIDNGYELDELHNVRITEPQNQDVLAYNSDFGVWENSNTLSNYLRLDGGEINGYLGVNGDYVNFDTSTVTIGGNSTSETYINGVSVSMVGGSVSLFGASQASIGSDADVYIAGNNTVIGGNNLVIGASLDFQTVSYTYSGAGAADAHRDALGSGAVGDQVFTAETQEAAQAAIGISPMSITEFLSGSGTITIPTNAKFISFVLIGGGGGGGSGCRKSSTTAGSGGTGGVGGRWIGTMPIPISDITTPITYQVGVGGAGGASQTVDDSNGFLGSNGTNTFINFNGSTITTTTAVGGRAGVVGANNTVIPAVGSTNGLIGAAALAGNSTANPSLITGNSVSVGSNGTHYPTSGGAAGGMNATGTIFLGGNGTPNGAGMYQVFGGIAGTAGSPTGKDGKTTLFTKAGTGGGGARTSDTTFAGNRGGDGGLYGGAGGGGSPSNNGQDSGAGGNGADGLLQVTFYY